MTNKIKMLLVAVMLSGSALSYSVLAKSPELTVTPDNFKEGNMLSIDHVYGSHLGSMLMSTGED